MFRMSKLVPNVSAVWVVGVLYGERKPSAGWPAVCAIDIAGAKEKVY
jgi:hypothetical protein